MKCHLLHLLTTFATVAVSLENAKKIISRVIDKRILVFLDLI